jgi:hydroxyacylglutathione hydrolase
MKIEQIYTGCLAQGAYYISSNGEAAIIDPLREVQPYIDKAKKDNSKIKYIFETHFHADFVSGHIDLAEKTGASIVFGPKAAPEFECHIAKDGEVFKIGDITVTAIHTPGHTMESTVYLLKDSDGTTHSLFTGDTLFLGDVGRPDLAQKAANMTMEDLAGLLYDSLYNKILPLHDSIIVYPAHGAGSACGKNMMKETSDTLGNQKKMNYALNQSSKEDFISAVTEGLQPPPAYFPMNVAMNKKGYASFDSVLESALKPVKPEELELLVESTGALVLDTRHDKVFAKGFIPGSVNISLDGQFAPWVGALIADVDQKLILVTEPDRLEETITRLSRVGFDKVIGYIDGGFPSWISAGKEIDDVQRVSPEQFAAIYDPAKMKVIDVRKSSEFDAERVEGAVNQPLDFINDWTKHINENDNIYFYCGGGYRSMMACSILKSRGIHKFIDIEEGFDGLKTTSIPKTTFVCQSQSV